MPSTLDDAIEQVLQDMGNLTKEELLDEIKRNTLDGECVINTFSSRVCRRETKSCVLLHMEDKL